MGWSDNRVHPPPTVHVHVLWLSAFNPWNRGLLTTWSTCIYLLTGVGAQVQFRIQKLFISITMLIILSRESAYNKNMILQEIHPDHTQACHFYTCNVIILNMQK